MELLLHKIALGAASLLDTASTQAELLRWLPKYGYFAILLAAFWEGEAVLIAAGALCGAGLLDWRLRQDPRVVVMEEGVTKFF